MSNCYCHTLLTSEGECEYCFVSRLTPEHRASFIRLAVKKAVRVLWPNLTVVWGGVPKALSALGYDIPGRLVGLSFEHEIRNQFRQLTTGG